MLVKVYMTVDSFLGGDTNQPINIRLRTRIITLNCGDDRSSILEVGCGAAGYFGVLAGLFNEVVGLEPNISKIESSEFRDSIKEGRAEALPFPTNSFGNILINEVLEHVEDDHAALLEVSRVLRPGGRLFLFAPNAIYPFESHGFLNSNGEAVWMWIPMLKYLPQFIFDYVGRRKWARGYLRLSTIWRLKKMGFRVIGSGYVPQTFENISGRQPRFFRSKPRMISGIRNLFELVSRIPIVNSFFCVSFYVVAEKKKSK